MKIKNIQPSLIVLFVLTIASFAFFVSAQEQAISTKNIFLDSDQDGLSDEEEKTYGTNPQIADTDGDGYSDGAEIKSGYDPLKKSPGDKLIADTIPTASTTPNDPDKPNLTKALADKISTIVNESDGDSQEFTIDQVKSLVAESINSQVTDDELPKILPEDIKIKKQDYQKLSEEKAEEKRKEDFTSYIVGLFYVMSSNSPAPITSTTDINSLTSSISNQLTGAIVSGDASSLEELAATGEKTLQQMKDIEVPEELVETHIKGLQLTEYAVGLQDKITPNTADPILNITNYSKMQNLVELMLAYSSDVQSKFSQYGLTYDDNMADKLKDYGISIDSDLSQKLTQ